MNTMYLIGSLRNPEVPSFAKKLRNIGFDVFDDWYAAGPEADDYWQSYEKDRGHSFPQALIGYAAEHVFAFDTHHLRRCDHALLLLPAGKSGHLELGFMAGLGKKTWIVLPEEPDRFDVMYRFATGVFIGQDIALKILKDHVHVEPRPPGSLQGAPDSIPERTEGEDRTKVPERTLEREREDAWGFPITGSYRTSPQGNSSPWPLMGFYDYAPEGGC